jgi:hypothetical protein
MGGDRVVQTTTPVQQAGYAGAAPGLYVAFFIANDQRSSRIDIPIAHGLKNHTGVGLAVRMIGMAVLWQSSVGQIGAGVKRADLRAKRNQLGLHPGMQFRHVRLVVEASRYARLVGYYNCQQSRVAYHLQRRLRSGNPTERLNLMQVADILVQHAIAVEEDGAMLWTHDQAVNRSSAMTAVVM